MSERVPLSFLLVEHKDEHPPVELFVDRDHPLPVFFREQFWKCTAVLERTAVLVDVDDKFETLTAAHDQILVDPTLVQWRTKTANYEGARLTPDGRPPRTTNTKSPWRASQLAPRPNDAAAVREASDQRALKNQQQVAAAAERERRLQAAQRPPKEEKEEVMTTSDVKVKRCKRCAKEKPLDEFPHSGIYGGYCLECVPLEKADRAAGRQTKPAKGKKQRRAKRVKASPAENSAIPALGEYDSLVKLLRKRDSLKAQLAEVQTQLQEALA